jgi:ankyrin repeat protein
MAAGGDPNALVTVLGATGNDLRTTALCQAAGNGRLEAAWLLLEGGADPSLADGDGATPLMLAAGDGQLEMLRLLLARGAAVDAARPHNGETAFHYACNHNQAECAEALARAGCNVGLKTKRGHTGRQIAEGKGHGEVAARLRAVATEQLRAAQAADPAPAPTPAAVVGEEGPVDQLAQAALQGDAAAVARLLAAGADPNASVPGQMPSGEVVQSTALCEAATTGQLEVVRLLLDAGAQPGRAAGDGTTPLMAAAGEGQLEVLRLLLARGVAVDVAHPVLGWTAGLDEGLLSFCLPQFSCLWRIPIRGTHCSAG